MKNSDKNKGQSLIEVLLAIAIFAILITGSVSLSLHYFSNIMRAQELLQAKVITQNSYEAVQSIAYNNWSNLVNGTHGLTNGSGYWELSGTSDEINSKYTRTITISDIERDDDCNIVPSGGTIDSDTKQVDLNLSWQSSQVALSKNFSQNFTNWQEPTNCMAAGEAGSLVLDVSIANIDATKKSLVNIFLTNEGTSDITIDKFTLTWTKPGEMTYIKIEGANHWHATSGIGSPAGAQPSGTEIDIVDFTLEPDDTYEVNTIRFNEKIDGSTVTITATMGDGSTKTEVTTPPFIP